MTYKLELERGRTYSKSMRRKSNGAATDLTGKTLVFHLRKDGAKTDYLTLSTDATGGNPNGSRLQYTNQAGGEFSLTLTDEETAAMRFDAGFYSFSLEYAGAKYDAGGGRVTVKDA